MLVELKFNEGTTPQTIEDEEGNEREIAAPILIAHDGCFMFMAEKWDDPVNAMQGWTWSVNAKGFENYEEIARTDEPVSEEIAKRALRLWATRLRKVQAPGRIPCADCRGSGECDEVFECTPCSLCEGKGYHEAKHTAVC